MVEAKTYPPGVPCWVDTEQPDLEAACHFYGALFGWEFEDAVPAEAPGSYRIARLGGQDVAAIAPAEEGQPVAWNTYVAVEDADAAAAVVAASGGTVLSGAQDAGPGGRLAICTDPTGARFRLWQARRRLGAQKVNEPGAWNFSTLHTDGPERAEAFYAAAFGWKADHLDFGETTAIMWRRPGYGRHLEATVDPGIRDRQDAVQAPPGFEDAIAWLDELQAWASSPNWHLIVTVADRDESVAVAERHGAAPLGSTDGPWARTAVIRDPQGAELTLSQFTPPER